MFKIYNPHQDFLLPKSASDFVKPNDLCSVIVEIVNDFDISPFIDRYRPLGPHAYHPKMMLGLLFYAYSQGVFSSRKIAERVRYDMRFMFVAGFQHPDFRTIADFRKNNIDLIPGYFKQIVQLCNNLGLITLRTVAIDGTKIKANASTSRTKDTDDLAKDMAAVEDQIARALALAEVTDENDTDSDNDSDESPYVKNLQELRDKLHAAQSMLDNKPQPHKSDLTDPDGRMAADDRHKPIVANKKNSTPRRPKINLTDPDCRVLKRVGAGYNAQLAVDERNGIIVATDVVDDANDVEQLIPMIDAVESVTDSVGESKVVLADSGYASAQAYSELESRPHIRAYVPSREDTHRKGKEPPPFDKSRFALDLATGSGTCPEGQPMRVLKHGINKSGQHYTNFSGTTCPSCPKRTECTKAEYRNVSVLQASPAMDRMSERMQTAMGQQAMTIRKRTVEPVIGIIKTQLGFRQFGLRGIAKVKGELALVCGAFNLKKLHQQLGGLSVSQAKTAIKTAFQPIFCQFYRVFDDFESMAMKIWRRNAILSYGG